MKAFQRIVLCAFAAFAMMILVNANQTQAAEITKEVTLLAGESNAAENLDRINTALDFATANDHLTVKIVGGGKYYVGRPEGSLIKIHSNTTFDLNGATLYRYNKTENLIGNYDFDNKRLAGGYSLSKNIVIKNGTLDGSKNASSVSANLVNLGHADGITVENVIFTGNASGHLIEFSGCQNVKVTGCTFKGYLGTWSADLMDTDAIQLDTSYDGAVETWNGAYTSDGSVCKNVVVENCTFQDYPSGVGNHHSLDGERHCDNITIANNTFTNTKTAAGTAIHTYAFENSKVYGNKVTGKYTVGILISGGSVDVYNNSIGTESSYVNYIGINCVTANSYVYGKGDQQKEEFAGAGNIYSNDIYTNNYAILVADYGVITNISDNRCHVKSGDGIAITGSHNQVSYVGVGNGKGKNIVNGGPDIGINLGNGSTVTNVMGNAVAAKSSAVQASSGAVIENLGSTENPNSLKCVKGSVVSVAGEGSAINNIISNTISTTDGTGIALANGAQVGSVLGNTVDANKGAIVVASGSKMTSLGSEDASNTLTSSASNAISVAGKGSSLDEIINNKITSTGGGGIVLANEAVVKSIKKNTIKAKTNAIQVASGADGGSIGGQDEGNDISTTVNTGIAVTNSGSKVKEIIGNTITAADKALSVVDKGKISGQITGNTLEGTKGGVWVASAGSIANLGSSSSGNTITAKNGSGLTVTGKKSKVTSITGNKISGTTNGLSIVSEANVSSVSSNTISASKQGMLVRSKAIVGSVDGNKITSKSAEGILLSTKGTNVSRIENNTITAKKSTGIAITQASCATVTKNKMDSNAKYGIYIYSKAKVNNIVSNTITKYGKAGMFISGSAVIKNIKSNSISNGNGDGISLASSKITGEISKNTISNCKKNGNGIFGNSKAVVTKVINNNISKCKGSPIKLGYAGTGMTVTGNVLKNNGGKIAVSGKGTIQKK